MRHCKPKISLHKGNIQLTLRELMNWSGTVSASIGSHTRHSNMVDDLLNNTTCAGDQGSIPVDAVSSDKRISSQILTVNSIQDAT
jgi:hypothetical protein